MKHCDFVHLHVHTEYSLLDGGIRVAGPKGSTSSVFQLAKEYNMRALAITDHGNMYGVIEFYKTCIKEGIKPIIGCEVYIAPKSRLDKNKNENDENFYHLTLLCKNEQGYANLMKIVSIGFMEGFYYKPRVDKEVLKKYSEGLIALSGCIKGEVPRILLKEQNEEKARKALTDYIDIFDKDDFYMELQDQGLEDQKKVNPILIKLANEFGIKCVATNDCHYVTKNDAFMHEVLLCIGTAKTLDDVKRLKFSSDDFYFKSPDEMKKVFEYIPEAVTNTLEIVDKCNLELDFSTIYLPGYDVPDGFTLASYLEHLCRENLSKRYKETTKEIEDRLTHELKIISDMGYPGYFLIVWDFIKYAKSQDIPVGPGRGSGAGSIVSYLLEITDIDPLKYGLIFERFLNPSRNTMPDLDIDFSDEGREQVINYVKDKYGEKNVAQIVTFGSMAARLAIRDVGRVLNVPLTIVDKIAKMIPFGNTIHEAVTSNKELGAFIKESEDYKKLIDLAKRIEGFKRHIGVHAAGIVISKDDMTNYVPFTRSSKDTFTTQYEGNTLVDLGLLKMDFLGLRNLSVIDNALKLIKETKGIDIDIGALHLDDKNTYKMLSTGKALGLFQMESSGMRDLIRKLKPSCIEDIIALIALYRPGPMGSGMLDDFVKRKHGKSKIKYDHPLLEPILKETYGVILYQEQVMQMAVTLAGFTAAQADNLRKAMGKKIPEIMEKERENFVQGAINKGIKGSLASNIFDNISKFGGYGFNKSHSTAYGIISYRTAYLKTNYPVQYMCALLNSELGNTDKFVGYINECKAMNIEVLSPDIQKSNLNFSIEDLDKKLIRFGMLAVKNVGENALNSIVDEREKNGEFENFTDLCRRIDLRQVNKKVVENLIKAGAFDSLQYKRASLFEGFEKILQNISRSSRDIAGGQTSFFSELEKDIEFKEDLPDRKEWHESELLSNEKEALGFYISGHPLAKTEREIKKFTTTSIKNLVKYQNKEEITLGGIITHIKRIKTKKGNLMAVMKIEDTTAQVEVIIFPKSYESEQVKALIVDDIVIVKGRLEKDEEQVKILASEVLGFAQAKGQITKKVLLKINTAGLEDDIMEKLKRILEKHRGSCKVNLELHTPVHGGVLVDTNYNIAINAELEQEIKELLGENSIAFITN